VERKAYNKCVGEGLKGRKLSKVERKQEFCVLSKTCSSKAKSRDEALELCRLSMSQPKAPRATKARRRAARGGGGGMRLVLITTTDCKPCSAAKQYLKDKLDSGLIEELNVQRSDEAADLAQKYGWTDVPKLLILDENGQPFSEIQITDSAQTLS